MPLDDVGRIFAHGGFITSKDLLGKHDNGLSIRHYAIGDNRAVQARTNGLRKSGSRFRFRSDSESEPCSEPN